MKELVGIIKKGLEHSIAQAFLIFSCIFIVISVIWAPDYIPLTLFTLFYALMNFKIESLRKHESLGEYAIGDRGQVILFTLIVNFLLIWWTTGAWAIIQKASWQSWYDPSWPTVSSYALIISLALIATWLYRLFYKMPTKIKSPETKAGYKESYEMELKVDDFSLSLRKSKEPDPDLDA